MTAERVIAVDENVPQAEQWFGRLGRVVRFAGRNLQAQDLQGVDALIVRSVTKVNEALLANSQVNFVGSCTIGCDHVDLAWLKQQGVGFANAPGCNANSVVEYVFAALAALDCNISQQSVGIVGAGNVGGRLLNLCSRLGISVCAYDPLVAQNDSRLGTIESVFDQSVVCLHAPLTHTGSHPTFHMIHRSLLERLPEGAVLISAGRGPVVDNGELLKFKQRRPDVKLVLDVWEFEPWIDPELLALAEFGSPHIAGYSLDGKLAGTTQVYEALCRHWHLGVDAGSRDASEWQIPKIKPAPLFDGEWQTLRQALVQAYSLADDDASLRAMVAQAADDAAIKAGFDQLRRNYPERREFRFHPLAARDFSAAVQSWLTGLGFPLF